MSVKDYTNEFFKILLAAFVSQTGSHLLTLSLTAYVYVQTNSLVSSAIVYVVSFLPSIFVSSKVGSIIDSKTSRSFLIKNELLSAMVTLICGLAIYFKLSLFVLCVILSLRSILSFVSRSAMNKWIKCISKPEDQVSRFKVFSFVFFISTAVSGVLASLILKSKGINWVVGIDLITFTLSALVIATLREITLPNSTLVSSDVSSPKASYSIVQSPALRQYFLLVCFVQALFQGAYACLVSFLPITRFSIGLSGVGLFQMAASAGIIAGFLVLWKWPSFLRGGTLSFSNGIYVPLVSAILALFASVISSDVSVSLFFFLLMNFAYEVLWLFASAEFFRASPSQAVGRFTFLLYSYAAFAMSFSTLSFALLLQSSTSFVSVISLVLINVFVLYFLSLYLRYGNSGQTVRVS